MTNTKREPDVEEVLPVVPEPAPRPAPKPKRIRLIPVPGRYIQGIPAVPMEVSPERAQELLGYSPPAFKVAE